MRCAQFQRFISKHSKKFGLMANGKVFKKTKRGASSFYVRSDKLNLMDLTSMYHGFKVYASNLSQEATWSELIAGLRKISVPAINYTGVSSRSHEQEFLVWIDKLASCIIPVNAETPLEKINFDSLEDIRRKVISLAVSQYHRHITKDKVGTESILPRALAAVFLYYISQVLHSNWLKLVVDSRELSGPVTLDFLAAEVMLSVPTLQKVKRKVGDQNGQ